MPNGALEMDKTIMSLKPQIFETKLESGLISKR